MTPASVPVPLSGPPSDTRPAGPHRRQRRLIEGHFRGKITPAGEHEMRQHLVSCAACRDHYARHLKLAAVDPQGALSMRERLANGLGLRPPRRAGARRSWWVAGLSAATACALVLLVFGMRAAPPSFESRGGLSTPGGQLLVYEMVRGGGARQAAAEIRADSALAFAYANIAHRQRLMVFAVGEGRRVYWYHPAWDAAAQEPVALDIERDDAIHELPQAITHHLTGPRLQIFGVFMDDPMSVRQMEALVTHAPAGEEGRLQLSVTGAEVTSLDLRLVGDR